MAAGSDSAAGCYQLSAGVGRSPQSVWLNDRLFNHTKLSD